MVHDVVAIAVQLNFAHLVAVAVTGRFVSGNFDMEYYAGAFELCVWRRDLIINQLIMRGYS